MSAAPELRPDRRGKCGKRQDGGHEDHRGGASFDIYVQRVSSAGVVAWTVSGVPLCALAGDQTGPALVLDGAGGAIVGWRDARSGAGDVYARRITLAGVPDINVAATLIQRLAKARLSELAAGRTR